jgi:hypothetical protein
MKTYLSGPMTGIEDWNIPAFADMALRLTRKGFDVINPHEQHDGVLNQKWDWYLRRDVATLASECDRVVLLPGWAKSRGASLEHHVAKALEMEIIYPEDFEEWLEQITVYRTPAGRIARFPR